PPHLRAAPAAESRGGTLAAKFTTTEWIWHNGEFIPWEAATLHVMSHVVHYGSSVFEGIRCYKTPEGPAIFRLPEHMRRLNDSARSEEHTSELQSRDNLVWRLLLEKKKR